MIEKIILEKLVKTDKALLILGARQVGKTTLLTHIKNQLEKDSKKTLFINCDLEEERSMLDTTSFTQLQKLTHGVEYLLVDEAQRLNDPGLTIKIIFDTLKKTKLIVTGSSSFDLKNKLSDPLTGRYIDFTLYPLSLIEILSSTHLMSSHPLLVQKQADMAINELLLFGGYPDIYLQKKVEDKKLFLTKVVESYLFKDIFTFQKIRYNHLIKDLSQALAYQIGAEINENELANRLKIDRKTIASYIDMLEKSFVIIRVYPFSRNPRREIGRRYKIYFVDVGIRNGLIGDFNPLALRADVGALWENFLIIERIKKYANQGKSVDYHFWRTYNGAEIDYIERGEKSGQIIPFELKYTDSSLTKGALQFAKEYKKNVSIINKKNYLEFLGYDHSD